MVDPFRLSSRKRVDKFTVLEGWSARWKKGRELRPSFFSFFFIDGIWMLTVSVWVAASIKSYYRAIGSLSSMEALLMEDLLCSYWLSLLLLLCLFLFKGMHALSSLSLTSSFFKFTRFDARFALKMIAGPSFEGLRVEFLLFRLPPTSCNVPTTDP